MGEDQRERADEIWNRACDAMAAELPPDARTGDVMLMRAIAFDGEVQNGGLLSRVEAEEEESLDPAIEALRWFGLVDAAERVERVRDEWRRLSGDGRGSRWPRRRRRAAEEALEELEEQADELYFEMPQGEMTDQLTEALVARLEEEPEAFSPI